MRGCPVVFIPGPLRFYAFSKPSIRYPDSFGFLRHTLVRTPSPLDGVAKSPIYCVVAGSANARRTLCTSARGRHHHALYIELLCLAIGRVFYVIAGSSPLDTFAKSQNFSQLPLIFQQVTRYTGVPGRDIFQKKDVASHCVARRSSSLRTGRKRRGETQRS